MTNIPKRYGTTCPVCAASSFTLLSRVWRNYHLPQAFQLDPIRWFAECDACATVVMLPIHDDFDAGGTLYYDQRDIDGHVKGHFESFQKPNYDRIREFLHATHAPGQYRRWLDVGSVGYPTTFDEYEFTTIEPDVRAAQAGEALFKSGRIHGATLESWHDDRLYDGLLFNNSFYCLSDPGAALQKAKQLLRPGGRLVITLSSNFAGASSDYEDGRILLIESLIFGETMQVYYNSHSLTYLAERHGFRLVEIADVAAYGFKTMKAHVYELDGVPRSSPERLDRSREQMAKVWREIFAGFESSIRETLQQINRPGVVLAGSLDVIRDLAVRSELSQIRGILPMPESHLAGAVVNGLRVLAMADVAHWDADSYQVVVCAFKNADALVSELRGRLGDDARVLVPTRRSGMEQIDFLFRDERRPAKGFALRELPRGRRRVRTEGRRIVVYGAGAGGREALERLDASGVRPVAICDGDPAKAGTRLGDFEVTPFADVPRSAYDLVVIASRPGLEAIAGRLTGLGLDPARDFAGLDDLR